MAPFKTIMSDILGPVACVFCLSRAPVAIYELMRRCFCCRVVWISKVQLYCKIRHSAKTRKDVMHVVFGSSIIHDILCICLNVFVSGHLNRLGFNYSV